MAATQQLVTDEILGKFKTYWDANAQTAGGLAYLPEILTEASKAEHGAADRAWTRIVLRHSSAEQRTLGGAGQRVFCRHGSVMAQVFAPFVDGSGYTIAQLLAQVARDAYEGKSTDNVWFRSCRLTEVGREGPWFQINLSADFTWDEVK